MAITADHFLDKSTFCIAPKVKAHHARGLITRLIHFPDTLDHAAMTVHGWSMGINHVTNWYSQILCGLSSETDQIRKYWSLIG